MRKNFICFPKQFFLQNDFIDTKNAVLTDRPNFSCSITGKYPKKSLQKMQKLFKNISFKLFPWRGRKQLESLADFFRTASRKFSTRYSKTEQSVSFAKNFHPKVSNETENPVLTTPLLFLRELVKKIAQCPKMKKNLEIKLFFVKMFFFGHVECSSNIPVEKLDKKLKTSRSVSKNYEKFHLFSESVFSSKWIYRYKECSFDRPPNSSCSITGNDPKKGPQKMPKLFKNIFFKKFPWRGGKQLESPADFFSTASQIFPLDTQKNTNL